MSRHATIGDELFAAGRLDEAMVAYRRVLNRVPKDSGMPASSILLTTTFHASIVFALLWIPPLQSPISMPDDAVEVTVERPAASLAATIQPMAIPEPPAPQAESAQTPTLENAVPEPEPTPELTLRDFPKAKPAVSKKEQEKPPPKSDPKPDSNKVLVPPPGATTPNASPPSPLPNRADVVRPNKARDEFLARAFGTKYLERMGIRPSHRATLTETSGRACPQDPEPYKLEITNNKLTVTNDYGIMFSITVRADGEIDQLYQRAPMAGDDVSPGTWMKYRMMGNVKSGKLEIWYRNCVYKLNLY